MLKILSFLALLVVAVIASAFGIIIYYGKDLPNYNQLKNYQPSVVTRFYATDGTLLNEYAKEKRILVPIEEIPNSVKNAFIAAEDKNFYTNRGIDFVSIMRATAQNIFNLGTNKNFIGGSTITQQVVKNFLTGNKKTIDRKVKEAILAFRISKVLSKDKILELYLNDVYLGSRSYGVAAASLEYFNKSIDELAVGEAAMLAAMPKAPSTLDPRKNYDRALERRNWVLLRMQEDEFISEIEYKEAVATPITLSDKKKDNVVTANSFSDEIKKNMVSIYGDDKFYTKGMVVRTTIDPKIQSIASAALKKGITDYDKRHGFTGPIDNIVINGDNWKVALNNIRNPARLDNYKLAVVLKLEKNKATIGLKDGKTSYIPLEKMLWAHKRLGKQTTDNKPIKSTLDVLRQGNVIVVLEEKNYYSLEQIPEADGAVVVLNPHNGRILSMVGGYVDLPGQFNRAVQAKRQPGSAIKPFIYLSGLENGFTPASKVIDAAFSLKKDEYTEWKPENYTGEYYGYITMRQGLEKSINLATVRFAEMIGIDKITEIIKRFGINQQVERNLSIALGTSETTLLDLTTAYAMLVNGGKKIKPVFIDLIQDKSGNTIYRQDKRECKNCNVKDGTENISAIPPVIPDDRVNTTSPQAAYQIVSMLEGVVRRGTATRAAALSRPLAGKTGTTNNSFDAWFIGFSPDLVVGVYVGYDKPETLGYSEFGGTVALPIFIDVIKNSLKDKPALPFRVPNDIKLVRLDYKTGLPPLPTTPAHQIIFEAFKEGDKIPERENNQDSRAVDIKRDSNFGTSDVY